MKLPARLTVLACALGLCVPAAPAYAAAPTAPPGRRHAEPAAADTVLTARYDLGDQAFRPPASLGYTGRAELAADVYYPARPGTGRHPLVLMQHGSWETCADAAAESERAAAIKARDHALSQGDEAEADRQNALLERIAARLWAWPCAPGIAPIPSSAGYDYLARALARRGFVVVSVGANGINATAAGQADTVYKARAALLDRHLRMWQTLAGSGTGPLRGALTDPRTGAPVTAGFRGRLDMSRVGLLGHSMGGGGVMQEIADSSRAHWPAGVDIKAAFTLGPTATWDGEPVTRTPFAVMWGTCDQVNTGSYFEQNRAANRVPIYQYTLTGGNHDFYNKQWSPSSGQVAAHDDIVPGTAPGTCLSQYGGTDRPQRDQPRLAERAQRLITVYRVTAFFERFLQDRTDREPHLTGAQPFPGEPAGTVTTSYDPGR
ncbi:alpha/beta hydrolase [Streptomyces sp. LP05-1]|uniref:Alpha/beta hydrolase n=1 Tax=Streptomyces pyxinae TaxID=2970734 RepID=A0ABT2CIS4_9ACTN|nr:alpha/beta hydrolase [Streptomyces sp. LP05-1]MCS0637315.1 alpha/beta hydrolase [Streptomyces sp. LP05-1]